ncbi:MAG: HmuY family protein [Bacteroidota bacterium]
MKRLYILLINICFITNLSAQEVDLVSVGASYAEQTYYTIESGATMSHSNEIWDLAFITSPGGYGISINEAVGLSFGPPLPQLELYLVNSTDFDNVDTSGMNRIYNNESSWGEGAFNNVNDPNNAFDLGWGTYNPGNNQVTASRVFVIKLRSGEHKKIEILSLIGGVYTFRYADLNGANETTQTVAKADFEGRSLAYFSFEEEAALDLEPEKWDLLFTRYSTPLDDGTPFPLNYIVTGVLSGAGVEVAQADGIDPQSVNYLDYEDNYITELDEIGFDWKDFDLGTFQWSLINDRVYFVKTAESALWKLQFIDFEGSSTGTSALLKTFETQLTSTEEAYENLTSFEIFPNPAKDFVNVALELNSNVREGNIVITNALGQLVLSRKVSLQSGFNVETIALPSLTAGVYQLSLQLETEQITQPLIIKQ